MIPRSTSFIPQSNPQAGYLTIKNEIDNAIQKTVEAGQYILGHEVDRFEEEFASFIGAAHGVGVASGTDAIEIALRSLDIGPGDIVITVSHTAVATVSAIERCGATPLFIDIDPATFTINPDHLETTIKSIINYDITINGQLKAIIPVHIYGHPADMASIKEISNKYNLHIIEDCAQAHGAKIQGKKVGTFGDLAAFSFYPTKNLGALGDGGIVVTNNHTLKNKLTALRQYGWEDRFASSMPGINSRLDEIQAAVLRIKLRYLDNDNMMRKKIAESYTQAIINTSISVPHEAKEIEHVYHQYVIKTNNQKELIEHLKQNSIGTAIHYPVPIHLQPAYKNRIPIENGGLPITEKICQEILSLPIYPQLTDSQIERIISALNTWNK